ncbi:hypothetical protein D9758_003873 [Tetrapyrgos nigripes]|uniref:SHSP domain-containing protein n=1 Tax=Tetrapyrgos nigripes TaxID=182062 RepID=A0A8H5GLT1_9AGAR|nr:hypothetical protein D9758_003873 [Tetrapyrgos nigripes]
MSVYFYEPTYNWDRFFDEAFRANNNQGQPKPQASDVQRFLKPKMDLHEDSERNLVTAAFEFPGVKKEDVSIDVHNGRMTVSAESKISEEHDHDGYAVKERRYGKFSRTLQLPQGISDEQIKASMADGVLTVTFPKASQEAGPKKVAIS